MAIEACCEATGNKLAVGRKLGEFSGTCKTCGHHVVVTTHDVSALGDPNVKPQIEIGCDECNPVKFP